MTRAEKFLKKKESITESRAAKFLKKKETDLLQNKLDAVKKSNENKPGFLEDVGDVLTSLAPLTIAPIKAGSDVLDLAGKIGNTITQNTIGKEYLPENVKKVNTAGLERMFPSLKPKNKAVQISSDVAEALTPMGLYGKGTQYVAKGLKNVPGLKTVGSFFEKALKGAEKYNKTNVLGTTGAVALPGIVESDDPLINLGLSLAGSHYGGKVGQRLDKKTLDKLTKIAGIKDKYPEGLPTTVLDYSGSIGKNIQPYLNHIPGFGSTKDVLKKQSQYVKRDLGIPDKKLELDVEGKNFGDSAFKAAENIEKRSGVRSEALKTLSDEIGEVKLDNSLSWYKDLRKKFEKNNNLELQFKNDPFFKKLSDLFKPYMDKSSKDIDQAIKRNVISKDLLDEFVKLNRPLIEKSPYGAQFLHNLDIDQTLGAAKNLEPSKLNTYQSLKDEASDYFKNVKKVFDKITGIPEAEKSSLIKELYKGENADPDKYYNMLNTIGKNLKPKEIEPFKEAVLMAIGNDVKSNQFKPSKFVENVGNMNNEIKQLIFGKDTKKVNEAVELINKLGKQIDPKEIALETSKLYKVIKNLPYAGVGGLLGSAALKIISAKTALGASAIPKVLDKLNTSSFTTNWVKNSAKNKELRNKSPEAASILDTKAKALLRSLFNQ